MKHLFGNMGTGVFPRCIGKMVKQIKYLRYGTVMIYLSIFLIYHSGISLAAGVVQLPQTGQTKCYDTVTDAEISCSSAAAIGQDGYSQAGAEWPSPRFTNLDGSTPINTDIVFDRLTGLQWPRDAGSPSYLTCSGGKMDWESALSYVACLNTNYYLGHNDWRLSNIIELASLSSWGWAAPDLSAWLNLEGFINVRSSGYWSSTTDPVNPRNAWGVNFLYGSVNRFGKYGGFKGGWLLDVLCVRGGHTGSFVNSVIQLPKTGQTTCYDTATNAATSCSNTFGQDGNIRAGVSWPNPRFTSNSGIVKDNLTGLVWLRDADCANNTKTWLEALSWAGNLQDGQCGLNDGSGAGEWRLPNVSEFFSLIDFEYAIPAVSDTAGTGQLTNIGDPFINVRTDNYYSTSTTFTSAPAEHIKNDASYGNLLASLKTNPSYVWPVFDNRKRLTLTSSGTGSGTVTADCTGSCLYPKNSSASLTAIPNSGSYFVWWTNNCSGTNALTTTVMDAPKTCNAVFSSCASAPIKNIQSGYSFTAAQGLNAAYNDDFTSFFGRTDTLALLMTTHTGNAIFNLNKNIVLQGGWDCGQALKWTAPAFIDGTITISGGSVVFDNIVIL